jgi:LPS export ABC transporter protein LptC
MPSGLRNLLLTILLIAAAAGTFVLRPSEDAAGDSSGPAPSERGFYLLDAVFSGLDESGDVVYRLAAARIEGSDSPEQMSFTDVEISYGGDPDFPWQITAETARQVSEQETLQLRGVVIESMSDQGAELTRIEAQTLDYEPDRQLASTAGPVRFTIGENRIDAVGLIADLRNEEITLESGVSGRVTP